MANWVYIHTNSIDGKKYIGLTTRNPERRWGNGTQYKNNKFFSNAIKKYGWDTFSHEVIECNTYSEMKYLEKYLISYYDTRNPMKGYNLMSGGEHSQHSEYTKKKISNHRIGKGKGEQNAMAHEEYRHRVSESKLGTKLSEEQKRHLSDYCKITKRWCGEGNPMFGSHRDGDKNPFYGKKHSDETRKRISERRRGVGAIAIEQLTLDGAFIKEWNSVTEAAEALGIKGPNLVAVLKGRQKSAKGYKFRYK